MVVTGEVTPAAGAGLPEAGGIHVRPEAAPDVPAGILDLLPAGAMTGIIAAAPEIAVRQTGR